MKSKTMQAIKENLYSVRNRINATCAATDREPATVRLVAVSKTHSVDAIGAAYDCGQRDFGENYLQEALVKIETLAGRGICWHFLGAIQSNKTQAVAAHFDWVHSVDRLKIAERLSRHRPKGLPALNICLQVNIDGSASKAGCAPEAAGELALAIAKLPGLRLRGLMAVPDPGGGGAPHRALAELLQTLNKALPAPLDTLSMGMTDDMVAAIAAGSTCVRVGTAIFGPRAPKAEI